MTFADQPAGTRRRRRLHSDEFKANAIAACMQPGMSMAAVAMAHSVNANLLRRWVREAEMKTTSVQSGKIVRAVAAAPLPSAFVPVALPAPTASTADIRIELQRGATSVTVTWPASATSECAAWMRELLR